MQHFTWNLRLTLASFALSSGFLNLFFCFSHKSETRGIFGHFFCPRFIFYITFTPFKRVVFHVLWPKFVLIIKVDEQVGGEVNFRSFCWRKWCVKDARVDGSISPQLGAPVQDVHVHLLRGTQQGNECIHFIYWNNRRVTEGILKGPTTTKKRQKKMQLPIKKTNLRDFAGFFLIHSILFFLFFFKERNGKRKKIN